MTKWSIIDIHLNGSMLTWCLATLKGYHEEVASHFKVRQLDLSSKGDPKEISGGSNQASSGFEAIPRGSQ